jgi:hypothetical protein
MASDFQFHGVRGRPAGLALTGRPLLALPRGGRLVLAGCCGLTLPAAPAPARTTAGLPARLPGPALG